MFASCSRRLLLLQNRGLLLRWACTAGFSSTWLGQQSAVAGAVGRTFASKPHKSKKKKHSSLQQEAVVDSAAITHQQQHRTQGPAAAASSSNPSSRAVRKALPQPRPLVLPDPPTQPPQAAAAAAPRFGRVPPSSAAAAAAAAAALRPPANPLRKQTPPAAAAAADLSQQQGSSMRLIKHRTRRSQPPAAAAATTEQEDSHSGAAGAATDTPLPLSHIQPRQHVLPWEVVDGLPQSSPFRLEALATGGIRTYMAYLRAARLGWPTMFDLGIAREQGYWGRRHLLQRERVLELVLQHLEASPNSSSSSPDDGSSDGSSYGSSVSAEPGLRLQPTQEEQQRDVASTAAVAAAGPWEPSDEMLEGLSEAQIRAVAAAAAAVRQGPLAGTGVTPDDVSQCLVDYFLFKRCMETLLLKRQHRQAVKAKHHALLEEYHKQQQQQQQQQQQGSCSVPVTLLSLSELSGVAVWDAFVDATLQDYVLYLHAAGQGAPSVFNTSRDDILDEHNPPPTPQQQQQQQQQRQQDDSRERQQAVQKYQQACHVLAAEARVLALLSRSKLRRPGHLTAQQLATLAVVAEVSPGDVVTLFEDFHACSRRAFREVLEELLTAAGLEAASSMGRF